MTDEKILDGGLQYVPQIAIQYIYLDFDGELTSYNGEILTVEDVEVKDSALTEERIKNILAELNAKYADESVVFVTERPAAAEYSTIFIGKTSAFDQYGSFAGLAETIDENNTNKTDNAFVNLDATATDTEIIATIAHETDHLLGTLNHGGEGINAYATNIVVGYGVTSYGWEIAYNSNRATVLDGGIARNFQVYSNGRMYVSFGGIAINTSVFGKGYDGGHLTVSNGGCVTSTSLGFLGYLYVSSGGVAYNTIAKMGSITVYSGGTADSITMSSGYLYVSSGGTATNIIASLGTDFHFAVSPDTYIQGTSAGSAFEIKNGRVSGYCVKDTLDIYSGGTAIETTVNAAYSYLYVYSGGTANSTTVNDQGRLYVSSGGTANFTTLNSRGYMHVFSGGTANSTTVNSGGALTVSSGGTANSTTVNSGGALTVSSGGTATNVTWTPCVGSVTAADGAVVTYTSSYTGVYYGSNNALLSHTQTMSGKVIDGGDMYVMNGGTANSTTLNSRGYLFVFSGGTANSTTVNSGGYLWVSPGGTANSTTLNSGGDLFVYSGGTANYTTVNSSGYLGVASGGTANYTTLNSRGSMYVYSGGTANATMVNFGGYLYVSSGGTHRGSLQIEAGAVVSAFSRSTIDFSVAERTVADDYLINDLSRIKGAPTYTITVAADQAFGTYKLAQGAGSFTGTLSVGDGSVAYGSVTVNGEDLVYNGVNYSLDQVGGNLTLTISGTSAPAAVDNDLDGNGLADTILRHTLQGYCGAWLTEDSTIGWGDLSYIGNDVKLLGMGNVKDSSDSGLDIFMLNGDTVAAWVTEGGKVTGYQSLYKHNANMNVLGLADFDGDGVTDYLLRSNTGDVGCIMGDGNRWNYFQSLGKEWDIAATGDFNGDGRDDLVLKHDAGFAGTWLTQENGSVKWAALDTVSGGLEIIGSGDFNGDGTDDVLLRKGNWVGAWLVEEGSVDSFMGIKNNLTSTVEEIADFDGDGIDDLRVREGNDIGVLYVKGAATTQWQYFKSVGSEWSTAFDAQVV